MCSSFEDVTLSVDEICSHIRKYGKINGLIEPCVYLPDIQPSGYNYDENTSSVFSYPYGINKNDKKYLPNLEYIFINSTETNALATSIKDVPIVGLYLGSIPSIEYQANLMIGSVFENKFPKEKLKKKHIIINDVGVLEIKSKDSFLGYKDERILSYLITETALRFIVLHEIGHHCRNHIANISEKCKRFIVLKASDKTNSEYEIEADTFAAQNIASEFPLVLNELKEHMEDFSGFSEEEINRLAINVILTAVTLPFSLLYQPLDFGGEETIPFREFYALMTLTIELYKYELCRNSVALDLRNKTEEELSEINNMFNTHMDVEELETEKIGFFDFGIYIMLMFIESKKLYYDVNNINNIDDYLKNYIKIVSSIRFYNENGTIL